MMQSLLWIGKRREYVNLALSFRPPFTQSLRVSVSYRRVFPLELQHQSYTYRLTFSESQPDGAGSRRKMGPLCQQSLETAGRLGEEDGRELRWPAAQKRLVLQYSVERRKIM